MKARIIPAAREDADGAGDRLEREHHGYGRRFAAEIRKALASIRSTPFLYPRTEDGPAEFETREYFIALFNYRVIYALHNSELVIVSIVHAARPPGLWVPRLGELTNPEESS